MKRIIRDISAAQNDAALEHEDLIYKAVCQRVIDDFLTKKLSPKEFSERMKGLHAPRGSVMVPTRQMVEDIWEIKGFSGAARLAIHRDIEVNLITPTRKKTHIVTEYRLQFTATQNGLRVEPRLLLHFPHNADAPAVRSIFEKLNQMKRETLHWHTTLALPSTIKLS